MCGHTGTGVAVLTPLAKIPDQFKPLAALGIGGFILIFLALFHGAGLHWILLQQTRGERRLSSGRPRLLAASFLFGWAVFLMLDLHMVEIVGWAFALNHLGLIVDAYDAVYFCANCYTTLGMGNLDVGKHWRILSSIIGISGLFTFAWTASVREAGIMFAWPVRVVTKDPDLARRKNALIALECGTSTFALRFMR